MARPASIASNASSPNPPSRCQLNAHLAYAQMVALVPIQRLHAAPSSSAVNDQRRSLQRSGKVAIEWSPSTHSKVTQEPLCCILNPLISARQLDSRSCIHCQRTRLPSNLRGPGHKAKLCGPARQRSTQQKCSCSKSLYSAKYAQESIPRQKIEAGQPSSVIGPFRCCGRPTLLALPVFIEADIVGRHRRQQLPAQFQNIDGA